LSFLLRLKSGKEMEVSHNRYRKRKRKKVAGINIPSPRKKINQKTIVSVHSFQLISSILK